MSCAPDIVKFFESTLGLPKVFLVGLATHEVMHLVTLYAIGSSGSLINLSINAAVGMRARMSFRPEIIIRKCENGLSSVELGGAPAGRG